MPRSRLRFDELIKDRERIGMLIEGSCVSNIRNGYKVLPEYQEWKKHREFIAAAIHKSGTILDIGCANGFLLLCLQNWTDKKLVPYGIDTNYSAVSDARRLFPRQRRNFVNIGVAELAKPREYGLPSKLDIIYWAVWDNFQFSIKENRKLVSECLKHVKNGGRLILGFYDPSRRKNLRRISQLRGGGFKIQKVIKNRYHHGLLLAILEPGAA